MIGHKVNTSLYTFPSPLLTGDVTLLVFTDDCLDGAAEEGVVTIVVVELLVVH